MKTIEPPSLREASANAQRLAEKPPSLREALPTRSVSLEKSANSWRGFANAKRLVGAASRREEKNRSRKVQK